MRRQKHRLDPVSYTHLDVYKRQDVESIKKVREEYEDVAVVCYINSTAALKEYSDVCVTSANAVKICLLYTSIPGLSV